MDSNQRPNPSHPIPNRSPNIPNRHPSPNLHPSLGPIPSHHPTPNGLRSSPNDRRSSQRRGSSGCPLPQKRG